MTDRERRRRQEGMRECKREKWKYSKWTGYRLVERIRRKIYPLGILITMTTLSCLFCCPAAWWPRVTPVDHQTNYSLTISLWFYDLQQHVQTTNFKLDECSGGKKNTKEMKQPFRKQLDKPGCPGDYFVYSVHTRHVSACGQVHKPACVHVSTGTGPAEYN